MEKPDSAKPDIVFGAVFLGLAAFTLLMTSQLTERVQAGLSIRTFPNFVGLGMAVLAVLLLVKGARAMRAERSASAEAERASGGAASGVSEIFRRPFVLRALGFAVLGVVYTRTIRTVGYVAATPLLILCAMLLYGEKKWYRLVLIPAIVTVLLFHLFRTFFRVPLPRFGLW